MIFAVLIAFLVLQPNHLFSHGFDGSTLIKTSSGSKNISDFAFFHTKKNAVTTYDFCKNSYTSVKISSFGHSKSNCFIRIGLDNSRENDLLCTPAQEFYLPNNNQWVPAYELSVGDVLQSNTRENILVTRVSLIQESLNVYTLEIGKYHNFFVGKYFVLTHNTTLPWEVTMGFSVPFGGACSGGRVGGYFGPIGVIGGIVVGGLIGIVTETIINHGKTKEYDSIFDVKFISEWMQTTKDSKQQSNYVRVNDPHQKGFIGHQDPQDPKDPKDNKDRIINTISSTEFFRQCKDRYERWRDGIYRLKDRAIGFLNGKAHYLQWDKLHNDVEVYNKNGEHLGSLDPKKLELYKNKVHGRKLPR